MERMSEKPELVAPARWPDLRPDRHRRARRARWCGRPRSSMSTWQDGPRAARGTRTIKITGSAKKRIVVGPDRMGRGRSRPRAPDRTAAYKQLHEESDKAVAFLKTPGHQARRGHPAAVGDASRRSSTPSEEIKVLPSTTVPITHREEDRSRASSRARSIIGVVDGRRRGSRRRRARSRRCSSRACRSRRRRRTTSTRGSASSRSRCSRPPARTRARAPTTSSSRRAAPSIGKLIVADMGIININPANSTQTSEEGNNDTSVARQGHHHDRPRRVRAGVVSEPRGTARRRPSRRARNVP